MAQSNCSHSIELSNLVKTNRGYYSQQNQNKSSFEDPGILSSKSKLIQAAKFDCSHLYCLFAGSTVAKFGEGLVNDWLTGSFFQK